MLAESKCAKKNGEKKEKPQQNNSLKNALTISKYTRHILLLLFVVTVVAVVGVFLRGS